MKSSIQKIAVVSIPRTGSTLICEMLAQHPQILGFGEIFMHTEQGRRDYHKKGTFGDTRFYPGGHKLQEYLDYLDAIARLEDKTKLSFKLMDYQEEKLWQLIAADSSILVIHARRKNILESLASAMAAEKSGAWHGHTQEDIDRAARVTVSVPFEELRALDNRRAAMEEILDGIMNPRMIVDYNDLSRNPQACADRMFYFSGLRARVVSVTQKKLNNRPLSDRVENYRELRDEAEGTSLEKYFTYYATQ